MCVCVFPDDPEVITRLKKVNTASQQYCSVSVFVSHSATPVSISPCFFHQLTSFTYLISGENAEPSMCLLTRDVLNVRVQ